MCDGSVVHPSRPSGDRDGNESETKETISTVPIPGPSSLGLDRHRVSERVPYVTPNYTRQKEPLV